MNKLNERLTLIANISVVLGIIFLAVELQQNTQAIQAQTRGSITEKQMEFYGWSATNRDLADVWSRSLPLRLADLERVDRQVFISYAQGVFREWEKSHYQFERGLFTQDEFEARVARWRGLMLFPSARDFWANQRDSFAPSFRAEIDRIVAELGG